MPWDALPEHINTPEEWYGTDWDNPLQRWLLYIKGWFAYSAVGRSRYWWANWRRFPKLLFAFKGKGPWRIEDDEKAYPLTDLSLLDHTKEYLSVIQYWTRWHFACQLWPFHLQFHFYWRQKYVPKVPNNNGDSTIFRMVSWRIGCRRDSDQVYWFPAIAFGGDFT